MAEYTIGISEARRNFGEVVNQVLKTGQPVTVFRNNKPCVVISTALSEKLPNEETLEAFEDIEKEIETQSSKKYSTVTDLMQALSSELS